MRPCNQCRQPVENDVEICEQCDRWNVTHPDSTTSPSKRAPIPLQPDENDFYADHSYGILMGIFCAIVAALFALVGLTVNGLGGFAIGCTAGIILGAVLFTVMVRM